MAHPLTIVDITARAVVAPLEYPVTTASGAVLSAPLVLIDIETDQDIIGRAYVFGYTPKTLRPLLAVFEELSDLLRGKPAAPTARWTEFETTFRLLGRQGLLGMALAGIDLALWDALARYQDITVAELLGGEATPIRAYDSYGIVDAERDRDRLEASMAAGYSAVKVRLGGGDLADDVANLKAVRAAVGPDLGLMVDYNQSLSVPEAARRLPHLAAFDVIWIEEPVPAEDIAGHAEVRAASPIPIQTGENWWFPEDAARAVQARCCDYAMLDLVKIGGVTGWRRAAGMCEAASMPVSSHLFPEMSAHLLAATTGAHYLEVLDIARSILAEPLVVENGAVTPRGPGFGLEWDEDAVARYAI
jgi:mandelate racemase